MRGFHLKMTPSLVERKDGRLTHMGKIRTQAVVRDTWLAKLGVKSEALVGDRVWQRQRMRKVLGQFIARVDEHEMETKHELRDVLAAHKRQLGAAVRIVHVQLQPAKLEELEVCEARVIARGDKRRAPRMVFGMR